MAKQLVKRTFSVLIVVALLCFFSTVTMAQKEVVTANTMDSLKRALSETHSVKDSIRILFNMYDVNSITNTVPKAFNENLRILNRIYDVALRNGDYQTAYEAVRNLAASSNKDLQFIDHLIQKIQKFPESPEKKETETFLKIQKHIITTFDRSLSNESRRNSFQTILSDLEKTKDNKSLYDRLNLEFALVLYGSGLVPPEQMNKYLKELAKLVDQTTLRRNPIKSLFYRYAPVIYEESELWKEQVQADSIMLQFLDNLRENNTKVGRDFKNYDRYEFFTRRRLMSSFQYLTPSDVEAHYKEIKRIYKSLPKGMISDPYIKSVDALYYIYKMQYGKALELLRDIIDVPDINHNPKYILAYLESSSRIMELDDMMKSKDLYIDHLKKRAQAAADTEYARLRVIYELDTLETSKFEADRAARLAQHEAVEVRNEFLIYAGVILFVFLAAIIIMLSRSNKKSKEMAEQLKETNYSLTAERDSLRRTQAELVAARDNATKAARQRSEFINNVSHEIVEPVKAIVGFSQLIVDGIPEERRKFLNRFIDIIVRNSQILQRITADILDTADMENVEPNLAISRFSPEKTCEIVAESLRPRLNEAQTIVVEPLRVVGKSPTGESGNQIDSDPERLEQILFNLLVNAITFCDHGTITIQPEVDFNSRKMRISVLDEGPGVPEDKKSIIFGRFEKLGTYSNGLGLGLYVSREMARLLEGDVTVENNPAGKGACFVITLPLSIRPNKHEDS